MAEVDEVHVNRSYEGGKNFYFIPIPGLERGEYREAVDGIESYESVGKGSAALRNSLEEWKSFLSGSKQDSLDHAPILNLMYMPFEPFAGEAAEKIDDLYNRWTVPRDISEPVSMYDKSHNWLDGISPDFKLWYSENPEGILVDPLSASEEDVDRLGQEIYRAANQ